MYSFSERLFINYKEYKIFLKTLTFKKLWNLTKSISSFYTNKWSKSGIHGAMPISLGIEPTNFCNLRCPECPSGLRNFTRPSGMLSLDLFKYTIDELHPYLWYLILYFQGEPYLHPDFLELVSYASQKNIFTATSTNAHFLSEENAIKTVKSGLKRIIISIDGTTQESYAAYRIGGSLEKVIQGTKNLIKAKKKLRSETPFIVFQFLVVKPNEHQVPEIYQLGKQLGVDKVALKTAQIYDYEQGNPLIPENPKYSRYKKRPDGSYQLKNPLHNECWKLWLGAEMTWDGKVLPCCFDKDANYIMGNFPDLSFKQIWNSEPYMQFRRQIFTNRKAIDICQNCTEGTKVWS